MKNLTIKSKLLLLSLVPLLSLIFFTTQQTIHNIQFKNNLEHTQKLVDFSKKISLLVHETQKERGMSAGYVGSKGVKFKNKLPEHRLITNKRRKEFKQFIDTFNFSEYPILKKHIDTILKDLSELDKNRVKITNREHTLKDTVTYYTQLNKKLLNAVNEIAKQSPSNEITKMLVGYTDFLKAKERAGIERAVLSGVFAQNSFPPGYYKKFIQLVSMQNAYLDSFVHISPENIVNFYKEKMQDQAVTETERLRNIADQHALTGNFNIDPQYWFTTITKKINILKEIDDTIAQAIITKISSLANSSMQSVYLGIFVIIFTSFLALFMIRNIDSRIKNLKNIINHIANQKEFSKNIPITSNDEFGEIQHSLNQLVLSIKEALQYAKNSASQNEQISTELVKAFNSISDNIHKETKVVNDIVQSSRHLESTLLETKDEADETKKQTQYAKEKVEEAKAVITDTINQIQTNAQIEHDLADKLNTLSNDAEQVKGVLSIIGDIADQTNLLALNAAIEAARAGEHGRGFAVVADEVRQLAEKTQKSLHDINATISVIVQAILDASQTMNHNIKNIETLIHNTDNVQENMNQISHSMDEVFKNIENTNSTVTQSAQSMHAFETYVEKITSLSTTNAQNVGNVEKTTEQMRHSSKELMTTLNNFKT